MSTVNNNKANISPIPTDVYKISTADVVTYLENQLGFKVGCDFTRWTGIAPEYSYVRMRCVFSPKDIIAPSSTNDYVDRFLSANASGLKFKSNFIDTIEPFMYPPTFVNVRNDHETLERISKYGLYGERLDEAIRFSKLAYTPEAGGVFTLYLRPERIIVDMLADPSTNKVDGKFAITGVHGTTSETIMWNVEIVRNNGFRFDTGNVSIDAIFGNR